MQNIPLCNLCNYQPERSFLAVFLLSVKLNFLLRFSNFLPDFFSVCFRVFLSQIGTFWVGETQALSTSKVWGALAQKHGAVFAVFPCVALFWSLRSFRHFNLNRELNGELPREGNSCIEKQMMPNCRANWAPFTITCFFTLQRKYWEKSLIFLT